jgi:cobalt-zinc-cadmium resistance protein CzcA
VRPEYKDKYSVTDLRTIQDWIVRRQLSGIPGVVEVNTWGGFLKQYEVAIDPGKLNALQISLSELYDALEKNNSVAGGGYIEKGEQAYFIRGEGLVENIEDIKSIVVKNDGQPIYVKDIAEVGYGSATRFGAITGNGEGEKVLGQIMMLKNGNSKEVIESVKARVESIEKSLPEGVFINGFLERSELINKTTFTITENLVLGSIIVIFVVVLLLGNWRSGLVVASIIPISLLFAISLMNIFNIDANLMSLGAIDFGIIIDGAVIIVEFIAFQIMRKINELKGLSKVEVQSKIDTITLKSASKMMNSAIFGQLIILIVFIPILSLRGIEGKMFRPMALTFSFALIGAMLLCLTYVPVVSSLVLKPSKSANLKFSKRLMTGVENLYLPTIKWALNHRKTVIAAAISLLLISGFVFTKMGGEFVPTLDEGDFVIQPVLPTGMSLAKTIETTTKIEQILLEQFPEVDQVVTRIGAAEVPTDPMSMEESDVIIKLKPKDQWVSASSKDELAEKFKEALQVMPEMEIEFTQPIEMRFNELITGVRADVAIKIFGEDLGILASKADEIKALISNVEGASDIVVEKIEGLPQMSVTYNRSKIARYGLNISDLNRIVSMGFAGEKVGSVFEGEKRFDLVLRLNQNNRQNLDDLKYLLVDTPSGIKIPLNELAQVEYTAGPAKISRDDTKRRIVVGINVRNRDLQSVVGDVQQLIETNLKLPPGYSISYGGQFENLRSAKSRLLVAVPIALFLIFIFLYFAFGSIKEALMVYSAIPLAAVGGILLLWLRDMPFSISAGVGFIALFGIAVLNGIVLIEHFKDIKSQGVTDIKALIIKGTTERLRPVLLTASAAALGFLPMAVSTSAGAEVQRPLATVVIGGLITATLLTLVVLPILYAWFQQLKQPKMKQKTLTTLIFVMFGMVAQAQEKVLSVQEVIDLAVQNNASIKASNLKINEAQMTAKSVQLFDKTNIYYGYDENNLAVNDRPIGVFGVAQDFKFPTTYLMERKTNEKGVLLQSSKHNINLQILKRQVYSAYYQLNYEEMKANTYKFLDSLYSDFAKKAERRFELGETNYLEMITAQSKQRQISTVFIQSKHQVRFSQEQLMKLIQIDSISLSTGGSPLPQLELRQLDLANNSGLVYMESAVDLQKAKTKLERQNLLPDLTAEYFQGTNSGLNKNLIGYQFGIKIPLLFNGQRAKIKAAKLAQESLEEEQLDYEVKLKAKYNSLLQKLQQYEEALNYYNQQGDSLSREILKTANRTYKEGEINFFQYIQSIETAKQIQLEYLENLNNYNQTIIELNFIIL